MENENKIMFVLLLALFVSLVFCSLSMLHDAKERDENCQSLGLLEYEYSFGMHYCEDTEGNLHYIKMDCKHWYWTECTAKPISVGDVRVR